MSSCSWARRSCATGFRPTERRPDRSEGRAPADCARGLEQARFPVRMPEICAARLAHALLARQSRRAREVIMHNRKFIICAMAGAAAALMAGALAQGQLPPTATITLPSAGPADPALRAIPLPSGKRMHLLPATL